MKVLGIHFGHDSSAALIEDGRPLAAIEEERVMRVKQYRGFPYEAIKNIKALSDSRSEDIDAVAIGYKDIFDELGYLKTAERLGQQPNFHRQLFIAERLLGYLFTAPYQRMRARMISQSKSVFYDTLEELGFSKEKITFHDHHTAHAASAYYCSPFNKSLILTMDGRGDGNSASVWIAEHGTMTPLCTVPAVDSIGQFYAAITFFLGFRPNRHEGKITGLAAFGEPQILYDQLRRIFVVEPGRTIKNTLAEQYSQTSLEDIRVFLDELKLPIKKRIALLSSYPEAMRYDLGFYAMVREFQQVCDGHSPESVAAAAQKVTEDLIVEFFQPFVEKYGPIDVSLAGGVFANVKVNQKIRELSLVNNVYVQPAMGDSGLALGAALFHWAQNSGEPNTILPHYLSNVYLGMSYSDDEILEVCKTENVKGQKVDCIEAEIARCIHSGQIVGRFSGALEWGPRALGNRSILIRPTEKNINQIVNDRLQRTEFMPFAPSCLDYRARDYFADYREDHWAADFMTITYHVYPDIQAEIEAVVHVDGTARPQIVKESVNPSFYKIIKEYESLSGIGLVINTSFNMHEEPIVGSPLDAIRSMKAGCVDIVAAGNIMINS